jgi:signal transduction histidine kinase
MQNQKISLFKTRQKISQDLHDDIGSSLSSIQIFSELAHTHWHTKPVETKSSVSKIASISKDLMQQMSDIVWSMKPTNEEKNFFTGRVKNFVADFLAPMQILSTIEIDELLTQKIINPHTRRSILLIIKEALNNIAKYSKAKNCSITFIKVKNIIQLIIKDDGVGFELWKYHKGNGLLNIENRCKELGGNCVIETSPANGVTIICNLPMTIFSY